MTRATKELNLYIYDKDLQKEMMERLGKARGEKDE